jgi:hypothetical protein
MSVAKTVDSFKPVVDEKGRRRFDKELTLLLRTRSSRFVPLQIAWQNDPDVVNWCATHQEHWERLVKQFGYNKEARRSS